MKEFFDVFSDIRDEMEEEHSLVVKTGCRTQDEHPGNKWGDIALIKILKDEWSTSPPEQLGNNGVFFAIWVAPKHIKKRRAMYNVHALHLAKALGYKLRANDFASSFRTRVHDEIQSLPNVSTKFGPGNLFQGHVDADITNLKERCMPLIETFVAIHHVVDDLLKEGEAVL